MRFAFGLLIVLGASGSLLGCAKSAPPPGKAVTIGSACNEPDKTRLRLEGFLRYRRGLMSFCSTFGGHETCDLDLYESGDKPADYDIMKPNTGPTPVTAQLSVPVGSRTGEMDDLPKKFTDADIKLHLASGATATDGSHIVVDGVVSVIPSDPKTPNSPKSCFLTIEWAAAK